PLLLFSAIFTAKDAKVREAAGRAQRSRCEELFFLRMFLSITPPYKVPSRPFASFAVETFSTSPCCYTVPFSIHQPNLFSFTCVPKRNYLTFHWQKSKSSSSRLILDSRNRTLEIAETVGFVELRALRVLLGENSRLLQEKT
ncbi:MAG: hypothetical protein ACOYOU_11100, partial [Kiritimatiellia bacterium]